LSVQLDYDSSVKILHLEAGRHFYGGARQVGYLINALAERGVENLLVCPSGHTLTEQVAAEVFEWNLGGDLDFSLNRRLERLALEQRPDVVHVHSRRGADTFGGRAAVAAGVPAILTRRVQSAEPAAWLRLKCRRYQRIVAISSAVCDELMHAGVADERLRLIPSAVDTALFQPDPKARARLIGHYDLSPDALIVGSAAQFIRRKGLDRLLPLAAGLIKAESRFRLLMFGEGRERLRLERQVSKLGLEGRVIFVGFTGEWPALVPGLDLLLHPARREGLGAVVLEAMSAGVSVIASAVGGIVDVIEDSVDGRLIAHNAQDDWHQAVLDLLHDPERRRTLGASARRKVEERFTIDQMTESYLELYREIAGNAGG